VIKKLRKKHHYSQEQLATLAGVSLRTIQRIESGHSASLETLKSLAAVFEIEIELLTGEIGVIDKNTEEWASALLWVRFGFWGIRDRKVAFRFDILSLTLGAIGVLRVSLTTPNISCWAPLFLVPPTRMQYKFAGSITKVFGSKQ